MDLQTKTDVESGVNKHIEEELDLTNSHLHTLDEVSFPPSLKVVLPNDPRIVRIHGVRYSLVGCR